MGTHVFVKKQELADILSNLQLSIFKEKHEKYLNGQVKKADHPNNHFLFHYGEYKDCYCT